MARIKGTYSLPGDIEPQISAPLDARNRVPTLADLTVSGNFPYAWIGMETFVTAENKKYRLIGEDSTIAANWKDIDAVEITVDSELSDSSTNPVQNKVVKGALDGKQATLVSGSNIATVDGESLLSNTNISISGLGYIKNEANAFSYDNLSNKPTIPTAGDITDTSSTGYAVAGAVATSLGGISTNKQDTLVSGTNIKTINNTSVLGEGNIEISVPITSISVNSSSVSPVSGNVDISVPVAGDIATSGSAGYAVAGDVESALAGKQATLVSGTNIATIDNESLLSNTNISISNLGYIKDEADAFSYSNLSGKPTIPTAGNISDTTSTGYAVAGDVATSLGGIATNKQDTLVSGTNIKTINSTSLLGSGDIEISVPITSISVNSEAITPVSGNVDITVPEGAELEDPLTTSMTVGGITSSTTYAAGTPLETILRNLLDPVQYPTFTNPSLSLAATGSNLLEKGATQSTTFTATFNRGSITPAYGTSGYRSGPATEYSLNSGTSQVENTWSETVTESLLSYSSTASYSAGEQPKDSKGGDYDSPLAAGSVNSNTITYEFVNALWANTSNIATVAKLALVSINTKVKEFNFPAATIANPEIFDVPAAWTVTAVEVLNTLNNQWETCITEFSVTDTTHNDAGGTSTAYKRYTCNLGYDMGNRKVRVKWA